jgi:ribosomal protein S13
LLEKLESSLAKPKQPLHLPPYVEKKERDLTDEEIEKLVEIIQPYFVEGQRQNLVLYLTGYLRKLNVSEESIYKLYEQLQPADDPKDLKARLAAIRKSFEKELEDITGLSGLAGLLGEETARELCSQINQTLKLQTQEEKEELLQELNQEQPQTEENYIYVEMNRKNKKYARCNYNALVIEVGAFEKNELIDKYFFVVHYKAFACCIEKIYLIENPLTQEESLEIHFVSKNPAKPKVILKGSIQDIWEGLKTRTTFVLETSRGLNVLTAVLNHYLEKNMFERKQEDLPPGFYYLDNKFVAIGFEEKNYTKEDLQKAALFLNEYIYSHPNPALIASIIRAGILLPFAFAQKQLVISGKLRKRMRYLFLTGETKTGKTTTAMLLSHMWNSNDLFTNKISYASFNTEARASKHLSNSTHILIVDEVSKDLETSTIKEILKYAQEDLIARSIQSKSLKQIHYPALAAVIMTSNTHFPQDPALVERFYIFKFRKTDKISANARAKYEKEDFKVLMPIAQFIWKHIKANGLRDDYIEYATEILKLLYEKAGVKAEWLDWKFEHSTEETEEEQQYNKETEFYNAVIKFFSRNVKTKEGLDHARSIYHALKELTFGRWIWIDSKDYVNISRDFLNELRKFHRCEIKDLEELSELTGWEKILKRYEYTTVWVVRTAASDFFFRLNYIPKLLDTSEFSLWTEGKFTPETPAEPPNFDKIEFDKPSPKE